MVALLGQIHEIKTAWKYAKVLSDLVLEMSAFLKFNSTYFTSIYLTYINGKDLKQQILMLIHKVLFPDTAYTVLFKQPSIPTTVNTTNNNSNIS